MKRELSYKHIFDARSLNVLCRGEQILGRLLSTMEDLQYVLEHRLTAMGDLVVDEQCKECLMAAQREISTVIGKIRERSLGRGDPAKPKT